VFLTYTAFHYAILASLTSYRSSLHPAFEFVYLSSKFVRHGRFGVGSIVESHDQAPALGGDAMLFTDQQVLDGEAVGVDFGDASADSDGVGPGQWLAETALGAVEDWADSFRTRAGGPHEKANQSRRALLLFGTISRIGPIVCRRRCFWQRR
jgi:hypothetical protein